MKKIYCEAMNSAGLWEKVSIWHDGTNNSYPKETWKSFADDFNRGLTAWKKIRMICKSGKIIKILKEKDNKRFDDRTGSKTTNRQ